MWGGPPRDESNLDTGWAMLVGKDGSLEHLLQAATAICTASIGRTAQDTACSVCSGSHSLCTTSFLPPPTSPIKVRPPLAWLKPGISKIHSPCLVKVNLPPALFHIPLCSFKFGSLCNNLPLYLCAELCCHSDWYSA